MITVLCVGKIRPGRGIRCLTSRDRNGAGVVRITASRERLPDGHSEHLHVFHTKGTPAELEQAAAELVREYDGDLGG